MLISSDRTLTVSGVFRLFSTCRAAALGSSIVAWGLIGSPAPAQADATGQWLPGGGLAFSQSATHAGPGNKRSVATREDDDDLTGSRPRRRLNKAAMAELSPRRKSRRVRVASLGTSIEFAKPKASAKRAERPKPGKRESEPQVASLGPVFEMPKPKEALTGNVNWQANAECLVSSLKSVIEFVAANFAPVRVNSTCRSVAHNRRVGGVRNSYHLTGSAADIRVSDNVTAVKAYLRNSVGGLKHYGGGRFHIDTGPRRMM